MTCLQAFKGPRYLQQRKQQRTMDNEKPSPMPGSKKVQSNEPTTAADNTIQCRQSSFHHCNGSNDILRTRPSSMQHRRHSYQLCCSTSSRDLANKTTLQHRRANSVILPQPSFSSSIRHHHHIPNTYTPQLDTEKIHASNPFVAMNHEQEGPSPCLLHCQPSPTATGSNSCSPCSSSPYLSATSTCSHHCCPPDDFSCDGSTLAASEETLGSSNSPTIVMPSPSPTRSSSSRIKSAFSKIIVTQQQNQSNIAKGQPSPIPIPTKSASLVTRIRLKFQKNQHQQQQSVIGMHKSPSMTRSSSLSSITWARLRSKKQVTPSFNEDDMELPASTNHSDPNSMSICL